MARNDKSSNARIIPDHGLLALIGEEDNALYLEACAVLTRKSTEVDTTEHSDIVGAALGGNGSPGDVLRNIIAHLPNYNVQVILKSYEEAIEAGLPEDVLLTDDHISVYRGINIIYWDMDDYRKQFAKSTAASSREYASNEDYRRIMSYALNNVADGPLIVYIIRERGVRTLERIMELMAVLKRSGHDALTEGLL